MKKEHVTRINLQTLNPSSNTGVLSFASRYLPCSLGRSGIKSIKREGDGATPRCIMPLLWVYYRPDRLSRPKTSLPTYPLTPAMGWCDDPYDANYNKPVSWPYSASAEHLWRDDHIYDLIVVLGFNISPNKKHSGSAIFWHLARKDFSPTAGCLAIEKKEMIKLIEKCSSKTIVVVS